MVINMKVIGRMAKKKEKVNFPERKGQPSKRKQKAKDTHNFLLYNFRMKFDFSINF
jgi:hypothetical protein